MLRLNVTKAEKVSMDQFQRDEIFPFAKRIMRPSYPIEVDRGLIKNIAMVVPCGHIINKVEVVEPSIIRALMEENNNQNKNDCQPPFIHLQVDDEGGEKINNAILGLDDNDINAFAVGKSKRTATRKNWLCSGRTFAFVFLFLLTLILFDSAAGAEIPLASEVEHNRQSTEHPASVMMVATSSSDEDQRRARLSGSGSEKGRSDIWQKNYMHQIDIQNKKVHHDKTPHHRRQLGTCTASGFVCSDHGETSYCQSWQSDTVCNQGSCDSPANCLSSSSTNSNSNKKSDGTSW